MHRSDRLERLAGLLTAQAESLTALAALTLALADPRSGLCQRCGKLTQGRRRAPVWCSGGCRMAAYRARRPAKK